MWYSHVVKRRVGMNAWQSKFAVDCMKGLVINRLLVWSSGDEANGSVHERAS